jgi:hypothetical protein
MKADLSWWQLTAALTVTGDINKIAATVRVRIIPIDRIIPIELPQFIH